jgi:spore maturation protein CgeB
MTPRYFERMGSKTLLFCSEIPKEYKDIFIDTVNCVEFKNDLSDFDQKLDYILNTPELYQNIVETAYVQTRSHHTWDNRANNLLNTINDITKGT